MKDAGKIALAAVIAMLQAVALSTLRDVQAEIKHMRRGQEKQAVVTGSLVTWAQTKGYSPYRIP